MIAVEELEDLVTHIDDAVDPGQRDELVAQFVDVIDNCDDQTLDGWLDAEQNRISGLAPDAALQRVQAVTSALSLGANVVKKGAAKVRQVLNRWIGRLKTTLTSLKRRPGHGGFPAG